MSSWILQPEKFTLRNLQFTFKFTFTILYIEKFTIRVRDCITWLFRSRQDVNIERLLKALYMTKRTGWKTGRDNIYSAFLKRIREADNFSWHIKNLIFKMIFANVNQVHKRIISQQKLADNCIKYKNLIYIYIFFAKMTSIHRTVKAFTV